jgi:hypothetical protein
MPTDSTALSAGNVALKGVLCSSEFELLQPQSVRAKSPPAPREHQKAGRENCTRLGTPLDCVRSLSNVTALGVTVFFLCSSSYNPSQFESRRSREELHPGSAITTTSRSAFMPTNSDAAWAAIVALKGDLPWDRRQVDRVGQACATPG